MDDALFVRGFQGYAICRAIGSASSIGIDPAAIRSASVGPSASSITSARTAVGPAPVDASPRSSP
jgi:hypothetical protein